jgi:hypothetical protein
VRWEEVLDVMGRMRYLRIRKQWVNLKRSEILGELTVHGRTIV